MMNSTSSYVHKSLTVWLKKALYLLKAWISETDWGRFKVSLRAIEGKIHTNEETLTQIRLKIEVKMVILSSAGLSGNAATWEKKCCKGRSTWPMTVFVSFFMGITLHLFQYRFSVLDLTFTTDQPCQCYWEGAGAETSGDEGEVNLIWCECQMLKNAAFESGGYRILIWCSKNTIIFHLLWQFWAFFLKSDSCKFPDCMMQY